MQSDPPITVLQKELGDLLARVPDLQERLGFLTDAMREPGQRVYEEFMANEPPFTSAADVYGYEGFRSFLNRRVRFIDFWKYHVNFPADTDFFSVAQKDDELGPLFAEAMQIEIDLIMIDTSIWMKKREIAAVLQEEATALLHESHPEISFEVQILVT